MAKVIAQQMCRMPPGGGGDNESFNLLTFYPRAGICVSWDLISDIWISSSLTFCQSCIRQRTEAAEPVWSVYQVVNTIYTTNPIQCPVLQCFRVSLDTWRVPLGVTLMNTRHSMGLVVYIIIFIAACFIICGLFYFSIENSCEPHHKRNTRPVWHICVDFTRSCGNEGICIWYSHGCNCCIKPLYGKSNHN